MKTPTPAHGQNPAHGVIHPTRYSCPRLDVVLFFFGVYRDRSGKFCLHDYVHAWVCVIYDELIPRCVPDSTLGDDESVNYTRLEVSALMMMVVRTLWIGAPWVHEIFSLVVVAVSR